MDIQDYRRQIDGIDQEIVSLFERRMALSAQIAQYKRALNLPIFVPEREAEKLAMVASQADPALTAYVQSLYRSIFALSREYQEAQP